MKKDWENNLVSMNVAWCCITSSLSKVYNYLIEFIIINLLFTHLFSGMNLENEELLPSKETHPIANGKNRMLNKNTDNINAQFK